MSARQRMRSRVGHGCCCRGGMRRSHGKRKKAESEKLGIKCQIMMGCVPPTTRFFEEIK